MVTTRTARVFRDTLAIWLTATVVGTASAEAQRTAPTSPQDTAKQHDSARVVLPPVRVRTSIAPTTGHDVGSGVPARLTIIDGREIDASKPRLLPDALATQPSISLYDDLGSPWKINLSTRGFTAGPTVGLPSGVTVFLDGVRQNEPDAQEVNFDLLPMDHVERVELLSGSASLLGPNSMGGAINLVTPRGGVRHSGEIELSGGSFGQYGADASTRGRASGRTDYYVGGGYERERGWRAATGARSYNALVNLDRIGSQWGLALQAYGARSRAETAGSLPESLFDMAPRMNFTRGDFDDLDGEQVSLSGHAPVSHGRGTLTVYVRRSAAERFNVNQAPDPNIRSRTNNVSLGGTADWLRARSLGRGELAFRAGVDGAANRVRVRLYTEPVAGQNTESRALTTDVESPSLDVAGYALADYRVGRVTTSAGGRFDFVSVPFKNRVRPEDETTNDYRNASPRLGVSVEIARGSALYASVGRSFRAPAILELGCADPEATCPLPFALGDDPPLEPVRATTYEVGGRWTGRTLMASASAYRTEVRDEIFFVASEEALFSGYFTNLDRTRREGIELSATGAVAEGRLTWYGNYTYARAIFESAVELFSVRSDDDFAGSPLAGDNDVEPGSRLPLAPDHQLKAGGLLQLGRGLSLRVDARYIGRQWLRGDEANATEPLGDYAVVNARIGYSRAGWQLSAIWNNLLDSHAATFGTFNENRQTGQLERFLTPLNGRAVKLVVRREIGD